MLRPILSYKYRAPNGVREPSVSARTPTGVLRISRVLKKS